MPFVHYLVECLNDCLGKREVLHKNMVKKIQPQIFEIEDHYAHVLMVIGVGFAFSGGMPMIIVACLFSLLTRYLYFKFIFIRFCRVPPAYNEALNDEALRLLPATLVFHCLLSIYMYGGEGLFVTETSFLSGYVIKVLILVINERSRSCYRHCSFAEQTYKYMVLDRNDNPFHYCHIAKEPNDRLHREINGRKERKGKGEGGIGGRK